MLTKGKYLKTGSRRRRKAFDEKENFPHAEKRKQLKKFVFLRYRKKRERKSLTIKMSTIIRSQSQRLRFEKFELALFKARRP